MCPLEFTATPAASPRYKSLGSFRRLGTDSYGISGTVFSCAEHNKEIARQSRTNIALGFIAPPLDVPLPIAKAQSRKRMRSLASSVGYSGRVSPGVGLENDLAADLADTARFHRACLAKLTP